MDIVNKKKTKVNDKPDETELGSGNDGTVEIKDHHIYLYGEITRENVLAFNKAIKQLEISSLMHGLKTEADPLPIHVHINSMGGSAWDGFSALDTVRRCTVPVWTYVEGLAASAATLISVGGKKRFIQPNSFMLIHQCSSLHWGNYESLKDDMKNTHLIMDTAYKIYEKHTKLSKKKLKKMLKHDLYFDADKCLKCGLIDQIL